MGIEIEKKFLLKNDDWKPLVTKSATLKQGYLQSGVESSQKSSVRVRICNDRANINIKSAGLTAKRLEYEYEIPLEDAEEMLTSLCNNQVVEKTRHYVPYASHVWEIDVFAGENAGLEMAEIELGEVDEAFEKPEWVAEEVTLDKRYYNSHLIKLPYRMWKD